LLFLDSEQSISNKTKTDKNNSYNNLKDKSIKYKYLGYSKSLIDDNKNLKIIKNGFGIVIIQYSKVSLKIIKQQGLVII